MPKSHRPIITSLLLIILGWSATQICAESVKPFWPHMIAEEMVSKPSAEADNVWLEASMDMPSESYGEDDFDYDGCGNLTRDMSRSVIDIEYDPDINKPIVARIVNGAQIRWLYSATGERLAEMALDSRGRIISRRDYIDGYIFENGQVERLQIPQGYVTLSDTVYHAYIHDYA